MTQAWPVVGWSIPESILMTVVLPTPLGPRKPTISPLWISKSNPSTAVLACCSREKKLRSAPRKPGLRTYDRYILVSPRTLTMLISFPPCHPVEYSKVHLEQTGERPQANVFLNSPKRPLCQICSRDSEDRLPTRVSGKNLQVTTSPPGMRSSRLVMAVHLA